MDWAIRTVREDDDVRVVEGPLAFGGPYPGNSDDYGTRATPKTDFHWDLFPDRLPTDPASVEPKYIRPVNYQHGFDPEIGLHRVGGFSPMRADKKAVWIQAQLDKHDAYYEMIAPLLDKNALAWSPESAEHAVRFARNGDWLDWPMLAVALTPVPSNPWNVIATRASEAAEFMVRVSGLRKTDKSGKAVGPPEGGKDREDIPAEDFAGPDKSFPIVNQASVDDAASLVGHADDPDAVKAKIIAIAKRKGLDIPDAWKEGARSAMRDASADVAMALHVMSDLSALMGCESDEPDQYKHLSDAFDCLTEFVALERAEISDGDEEDHEHVEGPYGPYTMATYSAHRVGKRTNASDQSHIDAIRDHVDALGPSQLQVVAGSPPNDETPNGSSLNLPARSSGRLTYRVITRDGTPDPKALRKAARRAIRKALREAETIGTSEARAALGK